MRRFRCFADAPLPAPGGTVLLPEEEAHHLAAVLRAGVGTAVHVVDGRGRLAAGRVAAVAKRSVTVEVVELLREEATPPRRRILAAALTKCPHFEDILQRAVELGMTDFLPLEGEFSVVELDARRAEKRLERWTRIGREALKQCERLWLPSFQAPMPVARALEWARGEGVRCVALRERSPGAQTLPAVLAGAGASAEVCFLVGPEGGWSAAEAALLDAGAEAATLSSAVLRAETAALAALAVAESVAV